MSYRLVTHVISSLLWALTEIVTKQPVPNVSLSGSYSSHPTILSSPASLKQKVLFNSGTSERSLDFTLHTEKEHACRAMQSLPGTPGTIKHLWIKREQEMKRFDAVQRPTKDPQTSKFLLKHKNRESTIKLSGLSCLISFQGPMHKTTEA